MGTDHPGAGLAGDETPEGRGVEKYLGQRFGRLTALALVQYKGRREMLCRCDCGTEKVICIRRLVPYARSCGCLNRADLIPSGTLVGSWTVLGYGREGDRYGFRCRCSCGVEAFVEGATLRSGQSTMCRACSAVRRCRPNTQSNNIWHLYRIRAKKQGIPFELSQEHFRDIMQNCTYCGSPPQSVEHPNTSYGEDFYHNGIDRQDSSRGYIEGNCVPCCGTCNYMKYTRSPLDFITWSTRVIAGPYAGQAFPLTDRQVRAVVQGYRSRAKRKGFLFTLGDTMARRLLSHSCSYCGEPPSNNQAVSYYRGDASDRFSFTGIDRVDPAKGYIPDNCRSACWACNNAKGVRSLEDFLEHVQRVALFQWASSSSR